MPSIRVQESIRGLGYSDEQGAVEETASGHRKNATSFEFGTLIGYCSTPNRQDGISEKFFHARQEIAIDSRQTPTLLAYQPCSAVNLCRWHPLFLLTTHALLLNADQLGVSRQRAINDCTRYCLAAKSKGSFGEHAPSLLVRTFSVMTEPFSSILSAAMTGLDIV
ncbi:hypothetical protein CEK25_000714 [Fusarium fujikuroi]|nr:hypothetical protein CEK25_000714 [Fusarium fujikuroi]